MERRLFVLMSVGGLLALVFGIALLARTPAYLGLDWMRLKLALVALLVGYHLWCYGLMTGLAHGRGAHPQRWYRWFNEIPTVFLLAIILLAVLRPDF
jgi:putative membrane protein